jgi:hypothetical protein
VSAKQNLSPPRSRAFAVFCQLLGLLLLTFSAPAQADSLEDAAHKLALKVCLAPHNPSVQMLWQESPETSGYLSESRKKVFVDQISACGVSLTENSDAPPLRVTISLTATTALLSADSTSPDGTRQIRMVEIPRTSLFSPRDMASAPHLTSELLWEQEKPVYSAIEWLDPATHERFLLLLTTGQVLRLGSENGAWKMMDAADLPAAGRRSRPGDGTFSYTHPEGKLELLFYRKACEFSVDGRFSIKCNESYPVTSLAVGLSSNCEQFRRNLITGNGDYTQPDRIILSRPAGAGVAAEPGDKYSASVDTPGPVFDVTAAENWKAAFAVVRNLSTGNYEVYRITSVCGN